MGEADKPKEGSMLVGVASIFAYLIGSLSIAFILRRIASQDEFVLGEHWQSLGYACLFIALGVVGQAVREGRSVTGPDTRAEAASGERGEDGESGEVGLHDFKWPALLLLGPLLAAWIQFELFFDNVRMFPVVSIVGGIWLGFVLGALLSGPRYRSTVSMLVIALFSFPLGILSIALPAAHFRTYGSNVVVVIEDSSDYSRREYAFEAELLEAPMLETQTIGSGTMELIGAFAEAETIETVVIDGVPHTKNEAGELVPIEVATPEEVEAMFAEAAEEDAREREAQLEAYARELAAHEEKVARIRRSGRLFSSPD